MKLKTTLILPIMFIFSFGNGQQIRFANSWYTSGIHYAFSFLEMKDSSFYLASIWGPDFSNTNLNRGQLVHIDKYGDTLWTKKYNTNTWFYGIEKYNDSSFVLSGFYDLTSGNQMVCAVFMNLMGDTIKTWKYGATWPSCISKPGVIHKTLNGGYIINSNESCNYEWLKIDSLGNEEWHQTNNMLYWCNEIKPDLDGGYVAVGSDGIGTNPYNVAKLDKFGNIIWQYNYGNSPSPSDIYNAWDVVVMPDSNYLVGCDGLDWQLMKINHLTGDTMWTRNYEPGTFTGYYGIYTMDDAGNGNVICNSGLYFELINYNGDTIWRVPKPFGGWIDGYNDVQKTIDGGFAFCGEKIVYGPNPYEALVFAKLDSMGHITYTGVYDMEPTVQNVFYPNPVQSQFSINYDILNQEKNLSFSLIDLQGKEVLNLIIKDNKPIDVSAIPNGIYIGELRGKEKVIRDKIIIQH